MEENRFYEHPDESFSLCVRVQERLPDLLEGYLDALTAEAIRAHLSVCYLCARAYNEMERTVKLIETLPFAEPVKDYAPAIMAAVQRQSGDSFQAPVVEMETKAAVMVSRPRTTTGQQRRTKSRGWGLGTGDWGLGTGGWRRTVLASQRVTGITAPALA